MRPYVADLARVAPCLVSAHPNAGLPNAFGGYDETPEITAALLREFAEAGPPEHRRQLLRLDAGPHRGDRGRGARASRRVPCRTRRRAAPAGAVSSRSRSAPTRGFVLIGERTNVTGSARFACADRGGDFAGAVDVALEQVRGGAN